MPLRQYRRSRSQWHQATAPVPAQPSRRRPLRAGLGGADASPELTVAGAGLLPAAVRVRIQRKEATQRRARGRYARTNSSAAATTALSPHSPRDESLLTYILRRRVPSNGEAGEVFRSVGPTRSARLGLLLDGVTLADPDGDLTNPFAGLSGMPLLRLRGGCAQVGAAQDMGRTSERVMTQESIAVVEGESPDRTLQQVFDVWVAPEVERRRSAGQLPPNFQLWQAQIVFEVDAPVRVRLNDEVRSVMKVRATRAIAKGEAVGMNDFSEVVSIELTDNDPNAGHITLLFHQGIWYLAWDTRYNAQLIDTTIKVATEFMELARDNLTSSPPRVRPFAENLFSAVELLAKAVLLALPDKKVLSGKTHGLIKSNFNQWSNLGNIDSDFANLLNELGRMRDPARYGLKPWELPVGEAQALLARAEKMQAEVTSRAPRRGTD